MQFFFFTLFLIFIYYLPFVIICFNYTNILFLGLDPALPLFSPTPKDAHLDSSDAKFVDVLHTNALIQGRLARCGHVDTYANQVIFQPGCDSK